MILPLGVINLDSIVTQTWTLPDQLRVKALSAPKSQNKLQSLNSFKSVEIAEIEDSSESISTLIHQTGLVFAEVVLNT